VGERNLTGVWTHHRGVAEQCPRGHNGASHGRLHRTTEHRRSRWRRQGCAVAPSRRRPIEEGGESVEAEAMSQSERSTAEVAVTVSPPSRRQRRRWPDRPAAVRVWGSRPSDWGPQTRIELDQSMEQTAADL